MIRAKLTKVIQYLRFGLPYTWEKCHRISSIHCTKIYIRAVACSSLGSLSEQTSNQNNKLSGGKCAFQVCSSLIRADSCHQEREAVLLKKGIILCMRPANERWRLIGWAHAQSYPCKITIYNCLKLIWLMHKCSEYFSHKCSTSWLLFIKCCSCEKKCRIKYIPSPQDIQKSCLFQTEFVHKFHRRHKVMVSHRATSRILNECWPGSISPYGEIRLQWVKLWPPQTTAWFHLHNLAPQSKHSMYLIRMGICFNAESGQSSCLLRTPLILVKEGGNKPICTNDWLNWTIFLGDDDKAFFSYCHLPWLAMPDQMSMC